MMMKMSHNMANIGTAARKSSRVAKCSWDVRNVRKDDPSACRATGQDPPLLNFRTVQNG